MTTSIPSVSQPKEAIEVAKCFIKIANSQVVGRDENGAPIVEGITNLKLQKMLYFAQATHLALFNKPLFEDEIQAWSLGPVVPSAYFAFKGAQNEPIDASLGNCSDEEVEKFLEVVWKLFGKYSASELVEMTHRHKPWLDVYKDNVQNIPITQESIKSYYKNSFATYEHT